MELVRFNLDRFFIFVFFLFNALSYNRRKLQLTLTQLGYALRFLHWAIFCQFLVNTFYLDKP